VQGDLLKNRENFVVAFLFFEHVEGEIYFGVGFNFHPF
jgi:hypothetical protein